MKIKRSNGLFRKIKKFLRLPYILYLRLIGIDISFNASMPITTVIENYGKIKIGKHSNFDNRTIIRCFNQNEIKSSIEIGNNFCGGNDLKILCCGNVKIGNNVSCAGGVLVTSENHGLNPLTPSFNDNDLISSNVLIEDGVWLGEKVIILPNVKIGKKSIIGAGSIVTKNIPEYTIAVGNPAKVIKKWDFENSKYINI